MFQSYTDDLKIDSMSSDKYKICDFTDDIDDNLVSKIHTKLYYSGQGQGISRTTYKIPFYNIFNFTNLSKCTLGKGYL